MKILGIETSCDDTGISVVRIEEENPPRFHIESNIVSSQIALHQQYGGVYPFLAKREHQKNLPVTLQTALEQASLSEKNPAIDAIAVTQGPGLSPCLWAGITFAEKIASQWHIPLIPVNHIEGHLLTALLHEPTIPFPAIALTASGGHTQLTLVTNIGDYQVIGQTRDDAAGEAFDKTARILGLEYPGGPAIAHKATKRKSSKFNISLPRPMIHSKDYDFSFSGLKTAVLYDYKSRPEQERASDEYIQEMAAEVQQAIIDVLTEKTKRAVQEYNPNTIILGGGVAANTELRHRFIKEFSAVNLAMAPADLCGDNGAMIAVAGYFQIKKKLSSSPIEAQPNLPLQ